MVVYPLQKHVLFEPFTSGSRCISERKLCANRIAQILDYYGATQCVAALGAVSHSGVCTYIRERSFRILVYGTA